MAISVDTPLKRARLTVAFSLTRIKNQVSELRSQQFPGDHPGPVKWLNLVSGLLDTATEYLDASKKTGIAEIARIGLTRDAAQLATHAYRYLTAMQGAGTEDLPYSIVPPLQRWFEQLGVTNSTLFRAELVPNYELRKFDPKLFAWVRNPSSSLKRAINQVEWPFLRVTAPAKAFSIIPHLAIVAHEIGHALFEKVSWNIDPFLQHEYPALISRIATRLSASTPPNASTIKFVNFVFSNWWQELSADAFAFYLTGPAFFFSLPEFSQFLGSGYGLCETHPANDFRRAILFDRLSKDSPNSFVDVFRRHTEQDISVDFNSLLLARTPDTAGIFNDFSSNKAPDEAAVLAELHVSLPKLVDLVYDQTGAYLATNAADAIYTPTKYEADLAEHFEPMLSAVPPIEAGSAFTDRQPTEFASILNVGWAVLLTKLGYLRVKVTETDPFGAIRLERAQGLLSKAVELSEAKRAWKS